MANFIPEQESYKTLTPFKLAVLQNFPYIEADFDALTNYGLMCKIVEYLNNVISNENAVESNVTALYNAFVSLHDFTNDYFDNLDVQEEINNKLDTMATDGSLYAIIRTYTDPIVNVQNERIASVESRVASAVSGVNVQNERIASVESRVASAVSGSPANTYATFSALQSADPDHSKIYVVDEDGEWYFWNTQTNQWKNGGLYQSRGILDGSITYNKTNFVKIDSEYNMFDGQYITGSIADNTLNTSSFVMTHPDQFNMTVLPITPGETYSIIIENAASYVAWATDSIYTLENGHEFDGLNHGESQKVIHFTAGQNENFLYVQTSNSSQFPYMQIVKGNISNFTIPVGTYPFYLKGLDWKRFDILRNKDIRQLKILPAFGIGDQEIRIEYNSTTHKLKNYNSFNIIFGRESSFGVAMTIPEFEKTIESFDVLTLSINDLLNSTLDGTTREISVDDLKVKKYFASGSSGYNADSEILLAWCSLGTKVYSSFNYDIKTVGSSGSTENIVFLGDSIMSLPNPSIPVRIGQNIGANIYDCTVPGSVLDKQVAGNLAYEQCGFKYISQSIVSGDFDIQQEAAQTIGNDKTIANMNTLQNVDFSTVTSMVCLYGTNDFTHGVVTLEQYKQTMKDSITRILNSYPQIKLYFVSPIYRTVDPTVNAKGYRLTDYVQAEKEVCEELNIPYFDVYHTGNINSTNASYFLSNDGLHLSSAGANLITEKIQRFITTK